MSYKAEGRVNSKKVKAKIFQQYQSTSHDWEDRTQHNAFCAAKWFVFFVQTLRPPTLCDPSLTLAHVCPQVSSVNRKNLPFVSQFIPEPLLTGCCCCSSNIHTVPASFPRAPEWWSLLPAEPRPHSDADQPAGDLSNTAGSSRKHRDSFFFKHVSSLVVSSSSAPSHCHFTPLEFSLARVLESPADWSVSAHKSRTGASNRALLAHRCTWRVQDGGRQRRTHQSNGTKRAACSGCSFY